MATSVARLVGLSIWLMSLPIVRAGRPDSQSASGMRQFFRIVNLSGQAMPRLCFIFCGLASVIDQFKQLGCALKLVNEQQCYK